MVQWTSYLFIKGMTLWNTLTDWFSAISYYTVDFTKYVSDYFESEHSTWYLLPQHSLPLSHKHIKNTICPQWKYRSAHRRLEQSDPSSPIYIYSIDWLSASLSIQSGHDQKTDEYSMDEFLDHLRIVSDGSMVPTLQDLFLLWCIDTHHWFSGKDLITFHIIDSNGDSQSYSIDDPSLSFIILHKKLRIKHTYEDCTR